ncbi:MAG: 1-acyl-sn-glycerol-3-phosphate acyltransferase [Subtercola sp.]|nr:1-acyl-sn-glycerol-3-phosphate acyltransferase [Subtercola sp.]
MAGLALRLAVTPAVHGLEHVREHGGPFIFVANHPSELDETLVRNALRSVVPRLVSVAVEPRGGIRGLVDKALSLRSASRLSTLLKSGTSVLLFAEKTRSDDGSLAPLDLGAAALGIRTGAPLVPVALVGTFRALPPWRTTVEPGRPRVSVLFSRPIRAGSGDESSAVTESIAQAISTGLAEESRGWYGAQRSQADGAVSAETEGRPEAGWRRMWRATATPTGPTRRRVWQ